MTDINETSTFDAAVYQLAVNDFVQGGAGGNDNKAPQALANRTRYLKDHVDALETALPLKAPLASPALTGTPTAPTPTAGDSTTKVATTAFVQTAIAAIPAAPVSSVAGRTGAVVLAVADVTGAAPLASPALTGTPTAPTPTAGDSTTKIATTAFATALPGRFLGVQVHGASGTYTPSAGMALCIIECQGGGGAGGGAGGATGTNVSLGAPGASGSYAKGWFSAASIGASKAITIGAGGAGASASAGATGGTSSVGALISAPGGPGGGTLTDQVAPTVNGNGVASSAPSGGNFFAVVGTAPSATFALSQFAATTGVGGQSMFGPGAPGISINTNGVAAANYGAGGGGTAVNAGGGSATGGAGKAGIVLIWEFG